MSNLPASVRQAFRSLRQSPGYTTAALLIWTLGLGVSATLYSLLDRLLVSPPAEVSEPDELVRANRFSQRVPSSSWAYPDYAYFREHARALSGLAAFTEGGWAVTAEVGATPHASQASYVSDNYFSLLGAPPALGRVFSTAEAVAAGAQPVAVASHAFWRRVLFADSAAVGKSILVNGHPVTVVGVAPKGFAGLSAAQVPTDLWLPLSLQPTVSPVGMTTLERRSGSTFVWLDVVGRLRPGIGLKSAQAEIEGLSRRLGEEVPAWARRGEGVELLRDYRFGPRVGVSLRRHLTLLGWAATTVLVIAGVNLALMLLARVSSRTRQMGVRMALGASRRQVVRQYLLENLLLAGTGAALAWCLAFWSAGVAADLLPFQLGGSFAPGGRVLAATLLVSLFGAALCALLPALVAVRAEVLTVLRLGTARDSWAWLREGLVVAQVALAVTLLVGAVLFVRSFTAASQVDLGFAPERRLVATLNLGHLGYGAEEARAFLAQAVEELSVLPGVERVSSVEVLPFGGAMGDSVVPEGASEAEPVDVELNVVGPEYFATLGIPRLAGREFVEADRGAAELVAVVNEAAARTLWPGGAALGRRLTVLGEARGIVGVVAGSKVHSLEKSAAPTVYLPAQQAGGTELSLVVLAQGRPEALARPVTEAIRRLDRRAILTAVQPLEALLERVLGRYRLGATLVGVFAGLALLLTAVGLYGVLAYRVATRLRTIGVKMALGASRSAVAREVVRRSLILAAVGIPLGCGAAWVGGRWVESFLFGAAPRDPRLLAQVALFTLGVVAAASWLPAWRAARVEPLSTLREE